jgi:3-oxoacyl-[acyl-carrier protein] reductase
MKVKQYDEILVGDKSRLSRIITKLDVDKFVEFSGDDNPLHVDNGFAQLTSFKEPVVHGMITGNLVSTLIGKQLPGPGSLWISQEFRFLAPVRIGDNLVVEAEVVSKYPRERTVDLQITAHVEGRGEVLRGKGTVKLLQIENSEHSLEVPRLAKRALVTGASGEIGKAISRALSKLDFHVIAQYNHGLESAKALQQEIVDEGGRCDLFQCDLEDFDLIEKRIDDILGRFGVVDVLVASASDSVREVNLLDQDRSELDRSIGVQLYSTLTLIQSIAPGMIEQRWGRIIAISSDVVHSPPQIGWLSYTVAKSRLETLIRQCSLELGPKGITSNVISPGLTDTKFISNRSERSRQVVAQATPNRRLGTPEDIASAISYICSLDSGHLNGQNLRLNGGIG